MIAKFVLNHDLAMPVLELLFPDMITQRKKRTVVANDFASVNGWIFDGSATEIHEWKHGSELCCWHCTRNITKYAPIGVPLREENGIYYVYGCFCSFSCAYTWNQETRFQESERHKRELLLRSLFAQVDTDESEIHEAPPKEILLKYGGFATNDVYETCLTHFKVSFTPVNLVSTVPSLQVISRYDEERSKESKYKLQRKDNI